MSRLFVYILAGTLLLLNLGAIWYVDDDAAPASADGLSWATAFHDLNDAFDSAQSGDEIRIAGGTYYPDPVGSDASVSFSIPDGVRVFGGYAGSAIPDPNQRDIKQFQTVLSGEYGDPHSFSDNARHVIQLLFVSPALVLDGVTITGGAALGSPPNNQGGAILGQLASLTIRNCRFERNRAESGGAIVLQSSDAVIENSVFIRNQALIAGGAIFAQSSMPQIQDTEFHQNYSGFEGGALANSFGALTIEDCLFTDNIARDRGGALSFARGSHTLNGTELTSNRVLGLGAAEGGGGAFAVRNATLIGNNLSLFENDSARAGGAITLLEGLIELTSCHFRMNSSSDVGGAVAVNDGEALLTNVCFNSNQAQTQGGAIRNDVGSITLNNMTAVANRTFGPSGAGVFNNAGTVTINNSILWENESMDGTGVTAQLGAGPGQPSYIVNNTSVQAWDGSWPGNGADGLDPQFVAPRGADDLWGTEDDNLALDPNSPCIDAGDSLLVPADHSDLDQDGDVFEPVPVDKVGIRRMIDDINAPNLIANGMVPVDQGAFEYVAEGDMNCDGLLDAFDIEPFITALLTPQDYVLQQPQCYFMLADLNNNDLVEAADIDPFIHALLGG